MRQSLSQCCHSHDRFILGKACSTAIFTARRGNFIGQFASASRPLCNGYVGVIALHISVRRYVNALYRIPPLHTVPTHTHSGEEVDGELLLAQLRGLFSILAGTQLVDAVHEMRSNPYFECIFTADLLFQHYDLILPMPKLSREFRSSEVSETLRYMRSCGASGDVNHLLQDTKGGRASGMDFVSTTHGILMGFGTSRTNKLAAMSLMGLNTETGTQDNAIRALNVEPIELPEDSAPLSDLIAFGGQRTFMYKDTAHGRGAVQLAVERMPKLSAQTLKIEPGCSVLSHLCGVSPVYDVLCDQDFPLSMERIGECGLNPFPVEWSEPRKLGITMRSVCLIARFAHGSLNAGGYAASATPAASKSNYYSKDASKNTRLFRGGHRIHGDQGAPLEAQIRSGELMNPVYQRPPRYRPPMHRQGSIVRH
ncbi:unnamed protein product [Phytomonas sp. EM1]|nr:unnamed protein product [Phytomonas sp. EM1]|eukprot:CCW65229.1 unnamed protein product [Phytomonas sp. isolate EM1]